MKNRVGEEKLNHKGDLMKIVQDNKSTIVVEFQDWFKYKKETVYTNFKTGSIQNPYHKSIYGVGYIGEGSYTASRLTNPEYDTWRTMIMRCYDTGAKKRYPAYYMNCTVCREWHNYQSFAKWYSKNYYTLNDGKRMHLDKDILVPGNKIYSPERCIFVPQRINMLLLNKPNKRGLPNGITRTKYGYSAKYDHVELGIFSTIEEAFSHYATEKEGDIKRVANEYKDRIPMKLYEALVNYILLLENDKNYVKAS
ncbi:hypothetical protein DS742_14215 [Lacrimispora amygdalina]|uniref:AP2 domain-containing protein n=1 Tax=Lacrimispora amygdalina TaxID=253257 RepID=A0A3E2NBD1_9FIRM|nr:hypothetical protein [Clostridium indicum]RFZ78264.1 hypothetical protein DS742_14215 [Clostridium indicum]